MTEPSYASDGKPAVEIDAAAAHQLVADGAALLIDVREPDEWAAGHAPQAQHMPLGDLDPTALPTHRVIIAVCHSGARSSHAAAHLRATGLTVRNLTGGMQAWAAAGLPIVSEHP